MTKPFSFTSVPEVTTDIVRKSKFLVERFDAYYLNNDEKVHLTVNTEIEVTFTDEYSLWSIEDSGVIMELGGSIRDVGYLFSSAGVARPGDTLGLAIRIFSSSSRQRIVSGPYECLITSDQESVDFSCNVSIPPGKLRSRATMELVLYVRDSLIGTVPGTILGVLKTYTLAFTGEGSVFPIITEPSDEDYLWKLEMIYEDIHTDAFSECVRIVINTKNAYYPQLRFDKDPFKSGLFIDIITNATVQMIEKAKDDPHFPDVVNNVGLGDGSIGMAIYEIIQGYVEKYDSISDILCSVQKKVYGISTGDESAVD